MAATNSEQAEQEQEPDLEQQEPTDLLGRKVGEDGRDYLGRTVSSESETA